MLTDDSKKAAEARSNHQLFSEEQQHQGSYKVLYDAVGELSPGLSEEAFSTLCEDARALELNQITLNFRNSGKVHWYLCCNNVKFTFDICHLAN